MKRGFILILLYCILMIPAFAQQKQPAETETLRINTALVTLSVGVTDKQGQPLTNLKQADFAVYEDGQLQELDFFGAEDQPISFGLVLDRSQSMNEGGKLTNAVEAALAFLRAGNPQNEAFCLAFNETAGLLADFTSDYPKIGAGLSRLWGEGGTALYDAILAGLEKLASAKHRRRALIVITDGRDEHSQHKLSELIQRVQQNDAQIYAIGFYSLVEAEAYREEKPFVTLMDGTRVDNPRLVFKTLAAETGAETFFPKNAVELSGTIARIAASLRRQYTLAYYPSRQERDSRYRRLEVKVKNVGKQQIKTRQGYRLSEPLDPMAAEAPTTAKPPNPKPAPPTPTTTAPTATSATPAPPLLRETFDQPAPQWPQTDFAAVKNGRLYVNGDSVVPVGTFVYQNFEASVTATFLLPPQRSANSNANAGRGSVHLPTAVSLPLLGLSFRINEQGYYTFLLAASASGQGGAYKVLKTVNGTQTELTSWRRDTAIAMRNQIKIRCVGPKLELYVNNLRLDTLTDTSHAAGRLSLLFSSEAATFDDLMIKRLD